ncbi:MAG TPA: sigma-70 family RNA polymerase sigma factor [Gemmataceae bacterium]|nr:sigma-70 family RNA polymerase sigma factor [Gemmataceae bacterium]
MNADPTPAARPPADGEPTEEPSDHDLLERFRGGDQFAATALYFRYAPRLLALAESRCSPGLAHRLDSEDIVQSVFTRFFRRAKSDSYEVPVGAELWKLLLVIALNKIRAAEAYHRAGKRDVGHTATANGLDESFAASGDDGNGAYLNLVVSEALERLPAQLREIVELRLQGYEVREIAEMTGRALRTVERLLKDARAKLGSFLGTAD